MPIGTLRFGTVDIPEIAITSATASGVAHRWTNLTAFTEEVANGRIWAGFHYRFLNSRRHGYGAADRRIRCEERDAASRDEFTLNDAQHCDAGSFHKRIPAIARGMSRGHSECRVRGQNERNSQRTSVVRYHSLATIERTSRHGRAIGDQTSMIAALHLIVDNFEPPDHPATVIDGTWGVSQRWYALRFPTRASNR